jgi:probable rRNA maturation factor
VAVEGRRVRAGVSVRALDGRRGPDRLLVECAVAEALRGAAPGRYVVEVAYADDRTMRRLNRRYGSRRGTTDVLAFPSCAKAPEGRLLGEVVVNRDAARRSAGRGGGVMREMLRYVVHGVLHLAGYDDHGEAARRKMWRKQEEVIESAVKRCGRVRSVRRRQGSGMRARERR